jgi:hypothetical protein
MNYLNEALEFENSKFRLSSTNDRILVSRKLKSLILGINETYKKSKDPQLMDTMKRLTVIKRKAEKRLQLRPTI